MKAVTPETMAVPPTVSIMPFRRPNRSITGPMPKQTIAVPTAIHVLMAYASGAVQPNSSCMAGRSVPNRP